MLNSLVKNWWAVGIVGVLAIILGVTALMRPGMTLVSLVYAFAAYAVVAGIFQIAAGATGEAIALGTSRAWMITTGVLSIIAGIVTMAMPGLTTYALSIVIGVWAVITGITQVVAAIAHRKQMRHTVLVAIGGAAGIIFGVYMLARPLGGLVAMTLALGIYAVAYGFSMLAASFQLKQIHDGRDVTISRVGETSAVTDDRLTPR